jgi:hypothetical protein
VALHYCMSQFSAYSTRISLAVRSICSLRLQVFGRLSPSWAPSYRKGTNEDIRRSLVWFWIFVISHNHSLRSVLGQIYIFFYPAVRWLGKCN